MEIKTIFAAFGAVLMFVLTLMVQSIERNDDEVAEIRAHVAELRVEVRLHRHDN